MQILNQAWEFEPERSQKEKTSAANSIQSNPAEWIKPVSVKAAFQGYLRPGR